MDIPYHPPFCTCQVICRCICSVSCVCGVGEVEEVFVGGGGVLGGGGGVMFDALEFG